MARKQSNAVEDSKTDHSQQSSSKSAGYISAVNSNIAVQDQEMQENKPASTEEALVFQIREWLLENVTKHPR
jgi:hypothetical protein